VASQVVRALAHAVSFAHSRAIVHRDLKPGNVLLAPAAIGKGIRLRADAQPIELKISDFGLAKCLAEPGTQTRTGAPVGTPAYMAPEQIGSAQSVDGRCDVYSLGAMLFHLLVGKPPFQAATVIETLQLVQLEHPVSIRTLQPSVPRDLETICLKCLQKEPERRYATADDLADDLQGFLEYRPVVARPIGVAERSLRWAKRNPLATVLVFSVLLATVLTTALWLRAEYFRDSAVSATLASEESNRQTLVALRKLTEAVVLKKFAQQDQLSPQDREYLKEIAILYGQLAQLPQSSVTAEQIRGEGHYWSGVVYLRLADSPTAVQHLDAAIEVLSAIESKANSEDVFELINDSMELMVEGLENSNQIDDAISIAERRIARCHSPPEFLSSAMRHECERSLIAGYRQLGHLYDMRGASEEALINWQQARVMIEAALIASPTDLKLLTALSGTLRSIASVETDPELRISLGNRAIELGRRQAADYPEIPNCLRNLAWSLYDQAVLFKAQGQIETALELVQEAVEKAQELVDQQPLLDEFRGPLAVCLGLQGELLNSLGRHNEAQDCLRRSIELLKRNLQTSPDAQVVLSQFARSWIQLLRALYGNRADSELIEQTRASAKSALQDFREVLEASGASLEKLQLLQNELESLGQESR
jgi:eukaryotic-like serine/threonine-protein kinase